VPHCELSLEEVERYDRQIRLIGLEGQAKLKRTTVLVVGVGGLGSPASIYLAAMGVGKLVIVDHEVVELSNLNRQILHWSTDLGRPKVISAEEKLKRLNPHVEVEVHQSKLDEDLARDLVGRADVVVDALDNWETRYLLNRVCVKLKKPLIHAGVRGMYGQLLLVLPGKGPCLECVFPRPRKEEGVFPVVGPIPGILAMLQTIEVFKLVTGYGEPSVGKLLIFDGYTTSLHEVRVRRRLECPVCGALEG